MKRLVMLFLVIFSLSLFSEVVEASNRNRHHVTMSKSHKKTMKKVRKNNRQSQKGREKRERNTSRPDCSRKTHRGSDRMY